MSKLTISTEYQKWILTNCPSTGDEVVGSGWNQQFSTPGGQATWWQCPSCGGWHITNLSNAKNVQCPSQGISPH